MEALLLSLLLVVGGIYFGVRNVRLLRSEDALREYVQNSPKAALWVRKYGLDGATKMTRESFLPLGLLISVAMVALGGWNLWRMYA
ncbi:hypothetical protein [Acidovorax radicis]|uniref:hypothetical protein n=1 Tax=Acidovorax radicis TaxID=758826 RepID=UPI001CFA7958|nr:hypothetical protein [Acidovorax radicis]UCV00955.1 hypothetical protein KI609_09570 [Acidovorax radicis]